MNYQVWTHDEYEGWQKKDCGDLPAVQREVMEALMTGKEPMVTVEIPYEVTIKIKEDKIGETKEGKAVRGKGAGAKGEGPVRPGDTTTIPELDQGSGDPGTGDLLPGE